MKLRCTCGAVSQMLWGIDAHPPHIDQVSLWRFSFFFLSAFTRLPVIIGWDAKSDQG